MAGALADIFAAVRLALDGTGFEAQATALATKSGQNAGDAMSQQLSSKLKSAVGAGIGAAAGAVMGMALTGANELDAATRQLQADTGMTAEAAGKAEHALAGMYKSNLQGFDEIGATMAVVHNALGLTGDAADALTEKFLKFGTATNQDAASAANAFADILHAFNLTADQTPVIMDKLVASHQKYNTVVTESESALVKMAPAMVAANMTVDDGIALLNAFQVAGIDAAKAPTALAAAVKKLKPGQDLNDLIAQIAAIPDPTLRAQKAMEIFGGKSVGWAKVFAEQGVTLSDYNTTVDENANAMTDAADVIESGFGNKMKLVMKDAEGTLAEFGTGFGDLIGIAQLFGPKFTTIILAGLGGLSGMIATNVVPQLAGALTSNVAPWMTAGTKAMAIFGAGMTMALPLIAAAAVVATWASVNSELNKQADAIATHTAEYAKTATEAQLEASRDAIAKGYRDIANLPLGTLLYGDQLASLKRDFDAVDAMIAERSKSWSADASLAAAIPAAAVAAMNAAATKFGDASLAAAAAAGVAFKAAAVVAAESYVSVGGAAESAGYKVGTAAFDMSTAAATAAGKIYTSMADIGTSFQSAASALISAGNAAIGAAYDPLINAAELVSAKLKLADDQTAASATVLTAKQKRTLEVRILDEEAALAKLRKNHASSNTIAAAEEVIAANKRTLAASASAAKVTAADKAALAVQLLNDRKHIDELKLQELTAGTAAQQAAKINGYLTGKEHAAGLLSSNPQEAEAAATFDTTLRAVLAKLQAAASGYGQLTGDAYSAAIAAGIAGNTGLIKSNIAKIGLLLKAKSPPGPESPLHEIDKWGARTGQTWVDNLVGAIAGGKSGIAGALGGLTMPGVAGGSFGMPYAAARPDFSAQSTRAGAAVLSTRGGDTVGGPTYQITIHNPEPRAAGPDIGRVLRRTAALGMA